MTISHALKKYIPPSNKSSLVAVLVFSVLWSWLFLVDFTNLAKSMLLGFILMFVAYLVMVSISSFVVLKTWPCIARLLKKPSIKSVVLILLVWAGVELLLAWLLSVVWMGREGSWDNMVPFVSLTPIATVTPLRFLTRLFGFFGTSAVIGTGIVLIAACIKNTNWRKLTLSYWAIVITLNGALWLGYSATIGQPLTATITSEHLGKPLRVNPGNSDVVIVPEYGLDNHTSNTLPTRLTDNSREVFITGTKQYGEHNGNSNMLIYGSNKQGFLYGHKKNRLIVGGEYLPMTYEMLVRTIAPDLLIDFEVRRAIQKGSTAPHPFELYYGVVLGNAACSSIISPDDYRKLTAQGATVLANSASLEIFRGSRVFALHHDGLAKFMATANARPFLQSANDWKAFAIDHNGNTLTTVEPTGQAEVTVQTNTRRTPYSFLGEWLSYTGIVFILLWLAQKIRQKRQRIKAHQ